MIDPEGSRLPACRRCARPVVAGAADYDLFEQMHYMCFHYEFEHRGDPDVECDAGGCPAAGLGLAPLRVRTEGVDVAQAGNTVVPAILALEQIGLTVTRSGDDLVAVLGNARFVAEDPVALLGLVKLVELRRPWAASDAEIDEVLARFSP
ncbi:hypothetical protein [Kineosporia sp. A_224]|uniref:hypothetical protein n=1 Tax=Kineosporia sp. A_224 TaxID=1962180 RepID=UPI0018E9B5E4|nr:hypothetical protein [Kineosporia sp. A_224]